MNRKKTDASEPGPALREFLQSFDRLLASVEGMDLSRQAKGKLTKEAQAIVDRLSRLQSSLDPVQQPSAVFDPSDPQVIGRFISLAMIAQPRQRMDEITSFYGAGVYAIYYRGGFPLYQDIAHSETPIYVGKADPAVSKARTPKEQGARLSARLAEHAKNIAKATTTLSLGDFDCRALVVQSGYESAAEKYLIHLFRPIWNKETRILYGIGKHGDSATTRANKRSPWDTIHAARKWAADSAMDAKTPADIQKELTAHFAQHPPYATLEAVFTGFMRELRQR